MFVCICYAVTETDVVAEIAAGARDEVEIGERCYAGTGCGSCVERICTLLRETGRETMPWQVAV